MARSVTLTTLLTRVRQRADLESQKRRTTDQEVVDHITEGVAELYDVIRGVFGQDYFRAASTFITTPNVAIYALPADFLSLLSVDVAFTPNLLLTCQPFMENERNLYRFFPIGWLFNQPVFYRLLAGNITFIPTPSGAFNVTVNYCPTSPALFAGCTFDGSGNLTSGGTQTIDGISGWEEYAILDAAIKCLIKDEDLDVLPVLEARKERVLERIQNLAPERDAGQTERVHDVFRGDPWGFGWGDD